MSVLVERVENVAIIRLNRPKKLNALSSELMKSMIQSMQEMDEDADIGCFIITGGDDIFAAGADIQEMANKSYVDMMQEDFFSGWEHFTSIRTPKIAVVSGYALGGGCELAMMCDLIFADETSKFGLPEIKLGVIPGMGGTQRLSKIIGHTKAMDMILTGRIMTASEAEKAGLIARIIPKSRLHEEAFNVASCIASYSKTAIIAAREAIKQSQEVGLQQGLLFERRLFHGLFATEDQIEGMGAFLEKRIPEFKGR